MLQRYEFKIFTLTRILGVGIRPLILYLCLVLPNPELGLDFALLVSAVASGLLVLANQNFRQIYDYFAGNAGQRQGLGGRNLFVAYIEGTILHMAIFLPIAGMLCWIWTQSFELTLLCVLFILLEKYFDDDQRIAIYQRRYFAWTINFGFRVVGPSLCLVAAMSIWKDHLLYVYTASALIFFGLYIRLFRFQFAHLVGRWLRSFMGHPALWWTHIRRYGKNYRQEFAFAQIWVFLGGNFLLLDRFIVAQLEPKGFAEYVFFSNLANVIPLLHGLLYFTKVRPQLVNCSGPILEPILSVHNWVLPVGLALVFPIGVFVTTTLGLLTAALGYFTIIGLGVLYGLSAIMLVVMELAFWRLKRGWMTALELISMFSVGLLVVWGSQFGFLTVAWVPWIIAIVLAGKLVITTLMLLRAQHDPQFQVVDLNSNGL